MKRMMIVSLLLIGLTGTNAWAFEPAPVPTNRQYAQAVEAQRSERSGPCTGYEWQRHRFHEERERLLRCIKRRWPIRYSRAHRIGHRESGADLAYWAVNPTSGACGIFQHIPSYWKSRARHYLKPRWFGGDPVPSCKNARANMIVSVRMMHQGLWSHWSLKSKQRQTSEVIGEIYGYNSKELETVNQIPKLLDKLSEYTKPTKDQKRDKEPLSLFKRI